MDKSKHLSDLKKTLIEFIEDISDNIAQGFEKQITQIFLSYFSTYPEIKLMKKSVKWLLPNCKNIATRNKEFLKTSLSEIFQNITKKKFPLDLSLTGRLTEEDEQTIWNYLDVMYAIVEAYKKNL